MSLIFGNLTQAFVDFTAAINNGSSDIDAQAAHFRKTASQDAVWLVVIGGGMFVCTYIYMFTWVWTGEHLAKRIRENYFRAVLRQDIAFFDNVGAGEVATRIQTDTRTSLPLQLVSYAKPF
jgi:ATP-binding cassette, subfamily B (MDR/TAP), member 1